MKDMRYSAAAPQIVKIVRIVVKFHPLLTVTSLICQVILLQDWIEEEVSNQWKALKVYCQSIVRALLDPITEKMQNLSKALQMHLSHGAETRQLETELLGKLALFSATFLLLDTEVSSKYDKRGFKTQLLLRIGLELLKLSKLWSQLKLLRARCSYVTNLTSNFTFFILAIVFAKFYDNSLRILGSMLFIAIYLLCLLVVLRPRTDFGLFSFIMGVIGSITYNHFKFTSPTWIIAFICFVLFSFKSWLDMYWFDLKENQLLTSTNTTTGSTSMFLILSSTIVNFVGSIFSYYVVESPLSDYKVWLARAINSVMWNVRFYKFYPKDTSLPSTNTKGVGDLILTIANVAQGIFVFGLFTFSVADYKDWLFAAISYVTFCFWLRSLFSKDLSLPSTNAKSITSVILSLLSIAKYSIMVLAGLEPRLYYRDWLIVITCFVLWWVRLRTSFPKGLLPLSTAIEFKATQWWAMMINTLVSEIIYWIMTICNMH
ncbi:hypothetical protein SLEP1_g20498 [Rubroshorea leprosula]|uniref:GPI ethanolamine phosphate transferase 2 n=1 Tax=Rubroshorea leprosula TaxID=152421 RepID=A0AAV5JC30_9ROSI|nr:hypothetical protein SLEP1_g20498 [Rubroshorea leprosula]